MSLGTLWRAVLVGGGLLLAAACSQAPALHGGVDSPTVLTPSATWQQSVPADVYDERVQTLTAAIEQLRADTSSGWVGRQDDVTGYLTQLRGGIYESDGSDPTVLAAQLLDDVGPTLFGVSSDQFVFSENAEPDESSTVALRAEQQVNEVPVVDGALTVAVSQASTSPRVTLVSGRAFPDVDVDTTPTVRPRAAGRTAAQATTIPGAGETEARVQGEPTLVVLPGRDRAALAWRVTIVGSAIDDNGISVVFVDAHTGTVLQNRPGQLSQRSRLPSRGKPRGNPGVIAQAQPGGQSVAVTGQAPTGRSVSGTGTRRPDGTVVLLDTTVPSFDPATGGGGIETYSARGVDEGGLPGQIVAIDPARPDPDAIGAHAFSRYVYDYYRQVFGRNSWDGQGGTLTSAVHFGGQEFCNAFFSSTLTPAQMVYGEGCVIGGRPAASTLIDVDIAGHEITHGVIDTSSGLLYTGQSGAMNESFADYFGNVIGNAFTGEDTAALSEEACVGLPGPTPFCSPDPNGGLSIRYMLNGNTFADYLHLLDPPAPYKFFLGITQDNGGVHLNSSIWNNAMWSVRTRLAQIDGMSGNDSPRARSFDQVAYAALDRYLTPSATFLDARTALEQAAVDLGVESVVLDVIRETFDANLICAGCVESPTVAAPVTATGATQQAPAVSGNNVAWVEQSTGLFGQAVSTSLDGIPQPLSEPGVALSVTFGGDATLTLELTPDFHTNVVRRSPDGTAQTLDATANAFVGTGSAEGAPWINLDELTINFVDAAGSITSAPLPPEFAQNPGSAAPPDTPHFPIGSGGGRVAVASVQGAIVVWEPGSQPRLLTRLDQPIFSLAVHGDRILAVTGVHDDVGFLELGQALLLDIESGEVTLLSDNAVGFGAAISADYAVWAENTGELQGGVAQELGGEFPDSDLRMLRLATGRIYHVLARQGQQGFPALAGNRLVWQEGANGGDDVYTGIIPSGL